MRITKVLLAVSLNLLASLVAHAATVAVRVNSGDLAGDSLTNGGAAFKGIPYAAAPTGTKRWQSPQAVAAWQGTRAATSYGAACEQPAQGWNDSVVASMSEDCLYLNVWTPEIGRAHV